MLPHRAYSKFHQVRTSSGELKFTITGDIAAELFRRCEGKFVPLTTRDNDTTTTVFRLDEDYNYQVGNNSMVVLSLWKGDYIKN
jgi:hypothetical protein